jgi:hypothetical protein
VQQQFERAGDYGCAAAITLPAGSQSAPTLTALPAHDINGAAVERSRISLDWVAVLVALAAIALVKLGLIEGVPW